MNYKIHLFEEHSRISCGRYVQLTFQNYSPDYNFKYTCDFSNTGLQPILELNTSIYIVQESESVNSPQVTAERDISRRVSMKNFKVDRSKFFVPPKRRIHSFFQLTQLVRRRSFSDGIVHSEVLSSWIQY